jgi:predicted MFS family arabinose efflux permease
VLLSSFYFLTLYLQGVSGDSPLEAGLAFLPQTLVAVAAGALIVPRLTRRVGSERVAVVGVAAMVLTAAWLSRLSVGSGSVTGVALPLVLYGLAQALSLSSLTTAGMAGVAPADAGVAGGLVDAAHHLGGALGLGILTTVFASAGSRGSTPPELLADRVGAAFAGGTVLAVLALAVTVLVARGQAERCKHAVAALAR